MLESNVGAGVSILSTQLGNKEFHYPLGKEMEVYDAELHGLAEAANIMRRAIFRMPRKPKDIWLFCDNQAAIRRIDTLHPSAGQWAAIAIQHTAASLLQLGINTHICWVPGHTDVPGNEHADKLAKEAAEMPARKHNTTSLTHLKRQIREKSVKEWREIWKTESRPGKHFQGQEEPHPSIPKAYRGANRRHTSQLISMRTGHGHFRSYLKHIPAANIEDPSCFCGAINQDPTHLLLFCPKFKKQRRDILQKRVGRRGLTMRTLLRVPYGIEATRQYLEKTGIGTRNWFSQQLGEIEEMEESGRRGWGWGRIGEEREEWESGEEEEEG